ncbi:MAG: pyridoxamine 5'-phosphate oxidase [Gammaproteobacteria bacterium]|jgi:pyridoxamine 5'-phosphate oxidase|nr:pyridoxamine 5'-phosphate oxidase [Gammaproteobacteria bacterium]
MSNYQDYRREYQADGLRREQLQTDPFAQFANWLSAAEQACPQDATSMTLATADLDGRPAARIVLLKGVDKKGMLWYTDSRSDKGEQLAQNPYAALLFYWLPLERQVRITGRVEVLPDSTADAYFHSRPRASQLSAAAAPQSRVVANRAELEQGVTELEGQIGEAVIPRPVAWIGYRLQPESFEFWQGRPNRLHDRFRYQLTDSGWHIDRLAP